MDIDKSSDDVEYEEEEEGEEDEEEDDEIVEVEKPTPRPSPSRSQNTDSKESEDSITRSNSLTHWVNLAADEIQDTVTDNHDVIDTVETGSRGSHENGSDSEVEKVTEERKNQNDIEMDNIASAHASKNSESDSESAASIQILPSPPSSRVSSKRPSKTPLPETPVDPKTFKQILHLMVQQAAALDRRRMELSRIEEQHAREMAAKDEHVRRVNTQAAALKDERDDAVKSAERARTELSSLKVQTHQMQRHGRSTQNLNGDKMVLMKDHDLIVKRLEADLKIKLSRVESEKAELVFENSRLKIELTQARVEASTIKYPEDVVEKLGERLRNEVHAGCLEVIDEVTRARKKVIVAQEQIEDLTGKLESEKIMSQQVPAMQAVITDMSNRLKLQEKQMHKLSIDYEKLKKQRDDSKEREENEHLRQVAAKLEMRNNEAAKELEELRTKLAISDNKHFETMKEGADARKALSEVHNLLSNAQDEIEVLKLEAESISAQLEKSRDGNSGVKEALQKASEDNADLQKTIEKTSEDLGALKLTLDSANEERVSAEQALEKAREDNTALANELDGLKSNLFDIQKNLDSIQEEKTSLITFLNEIREINDNLKKELDQSEENLSNLQQELTEARENNMTLEAIISENTETITRLTKELEDAKTNQVASQSDLDSAHNEIANLKESLEAAENHKSDLHKKLDDAVARHDELSAELETDSQTISTLQIELQVLKDDHLESLNRNQRTITSLEEAETSYRKAQANLADVLQERDRLIAEKDDFEKELSATKIQISELSTSFARLQANYTKATEHVHKLEAARARVAATLAVKHGTPISSPDRSYLTITTPTSSPPPSATGMLPSGALSQSGHRAKRKRMSTSLSLASDYDAGEGSSSQPITVNELEPNTLLAQSFSQTESVPPLARLNSHAESIVTEPAGEA